MSLDKTDRDVRVLMVDDEESFLDVATEALTARGCKVVTAISAREAMSKLESVFFDVVVLDIRMPGMDGISLLDKLSKERPTLQVIMLSGHATVPMAVEAMKLGAFEFLMKPLDVESLIDSIRRGASRARQERYNLAREGELGRVREAEPVVGQSEAMARVFEAMDRAADCDLPVLITGESGTGKELVAREVHARSARSSHPLVVVDGSTLREELLASELFGHEKGAFTGAVTKKAGLFEVADRGSIFLDEIGEISVANQASLLRVIEYGTFRPVGGVREVRADVRLIAATNIQIEKAVAGGGFRQDLYYRLKGVAIHIPPLRERRDDIPFLALYFLNLASKKRGTSLEISPEVLEILTAYSWSGNVRELRYTIELAVLLAEDEGKIKPHHLPEEVRRGKEKSTPSELEEISVPREDLSLEDFRNRYECSYVSHLLDKFNGNRSQVAKILGISSSVFYRMLRRLGLYS